MIDVIPVNLTQSTSKSFAHPMRFTLFLVVFLTALSLQAEPKKIVLLAGSRSHGPGEHEFRAGCLLLAHALENHPEVQVTVVSNGWPADPSVFSGAAAVVTYADGGSGHPVIQPDRIKLLDQLASHGVGIGAMHYGVEVPAGEPGFAMLRWTGGYFEAFWSINPTWTARFNSLPDHPVARGVKPFEIHDEWYYHMRFAPNLQGVTPILSVIPPKETLNRPNGPHSGNPFVRAAAARGESQHLMWVLERPDGGRGFGFTGGHYHKNWGDENFRKLVLNAFYWIAKVEIPGSGVASSISAADLGSNLDVK